MNNYEFDLSIITLSKNDNKLFNRTFESILKQIFNYKLEWIILDASIIEQQKNKLKKIEDLLDLKLNKNFFTRHINMNNLKIYGIYPSMNYGKKIARGEFVLFLNSGDELFCSNTIRELLKKTNFKNKKNLIVFGQAKIIANQISWLFPSNRLSDFKKWLVFFEPNHQSMIVSNALAQKYEFSNLHGIISDGYWKRKILNDAEEIIYLDQPVCNFYLDGISSTKPNFLLVKDTLKNKNLSKKRKLIFIIKFLIPRKIFFIYHYLQKLKSIIIDIIF